MLPKAENSALLVIDMQNGFCNKGGSCDRMGLPIERLQSAIEPCERLIAAARAQSVPVIYTRYVYRADYRDGGLLVKELMPALETCKALIAGSEDAEILPLLAPHDGDYVLDKNRASAFYATPLETWLRGLGIEDLVVCGVTTNCCVETSVRDASQRDYRTFVVADAVAEYDDERHSVALKAIAMLFGYVTDTTSVETAWADHD
jgi:ureidoacrylate peracid hydrolase